MDEGSAVSPSGEMADAGDLKSPGRKVMQVRVLPRAPCALSLGAERLGEACDLEEQILLGRSVGRGLGRERDFGEACEQKYAGLEEVRRDARSEQHAARLAPPAPAQLREGRRGARDLGPANNERDCVRARRVPGQKVFCRAREFIAKNGVRNAGWRIHRVGE